MSAVTEEAARPAKLARVESPATLGSGSGSGSSPKAVPSRAATPDEFITPPPTACGPFRRVKVGGLSVRRHAEGEGLVHCSGHALALTLRRRYRETLASATVLEVGTSDGLAGMTAAKCGAAKVFLAEPNHGNGLALAVEVARNGVFRETEVVQWDCGARPPKPLFDARVDVVLGADIFFTPWEATKVVAALDAFAGRSPDVVVLVALTRVFSSMETECLEVLEKKGWSRREIALHPDDADAACREFVDDQADAESILQHVAVFEFAKKPSDTRS